MTKIPDRVNDLREGAAQVIERNFAPQLTA
jgi:hypothetical protein